MTRHRLPGLKSPTGISANLLRAHLGEALVRQGLLLFLCVTPSVTGHRYTPIKGGCVT